MRKDYLFKNFKNGYKKAMAGTVTAALVVTSTFAYNAWAGKEDADETNSDGISSETEIKDKIKDSINIESKDVDKDEIVYVISDAAGTPQKTIVSDRLMNKDGSATITDVSDLTDIVNVKGDETFEQNGNDITWNAAGKDIYYQGTTTKETPVSVKVAYYLDGTEITPEELAGKSGKVKMRFDYTNHEKVQTEIDGKEEEIYVPFVAVTGMILGENFQNIEVTNGKTISDGTNNVVVGYAMPGLTESLGINEEDLEDVTIPDYVEVTADVEDFSLEMTLTVVANNSEFNIDDIDLSELDEKVNEIADSTNLLNDGSNQLADGIGTLKNSLHPFQTGMNTLKNGIIDYTNGASEIASGISTLNGSVPSLTNGVKDIKKGVDAVYDNFGTKKDSKTIRGGMSEIVSGSKELKTGAATLKDGTSKLSEGTKTLDTGAQSLAAGASSLNDGVGQLATAVGTLGSEIEKQEQGIYTQLSAAGIGSYNEAAKALSDAKNLQTVLLQAIANDTYTGLTVYGVTDSVSAAKLLTDITSKVNSLNEAVSSLTVMDQIAAPLAEKSEDIKTLVTGAKQVKEGAAQVAAGTKSVKENVKLLDSGAGSLSKGITSLSTGAGTLQSGIETLYTKAISPLHTGVGTLSDSVPKLTSGVKKLYNGSKTLVANNDKLKNGVSELEEGTGKLVEGVDELYDGANELADGIEKFNEEGIQKIVDAYEGDVKSLVNRINAVIHAGEEYQIFTQAAEGQSTAVKFMIKTDSIQK